MVVAGGGVDFYFTSVWAGAGREWALALGWRPDKKQLLPWQRGKGAGSFDVRLSLLSNFLLVVIIFPQ